jgi:hypothetical protein
MQRSLPWIVFAVRKRIQANESIEGWPCQPPRRGARCIEADLVDHIAEVDDRRLYAREACSSMFE